MNPRRGLVLAVALVGCTADPVSLGEPVGDGTMGATMGSDAGTDGSEGQGSMSGTGEGTTGSGSADDGSTDGGPTDGGSTGATGVDTGDASTSSGDGGSTTTGQPGDAAAVLFVQFDGAILTAGADDATNDQSALAGSFNGMPLAPFGMGPKREQIMTILGDLWAPFDVEVTQVRPRTGDYAMVVVTPTNPFGTALGVATQDCGDANPGSVGMVFSSFDDGLSAEVVALAISHEAGRGYGLENVEGIDVMAMFVMPGSSFTDQCLTLADMPLCSAEHEVYCPAGQQNSFAELQGLFPPP